MGTIYYFSLIIYGFLDKGDLMSFRGIFSENSWHLDYNTMSSSVNLSSMDRSTSSSGLGSSLLIYNQSIF